MLSEEQISEIRAHLEKAQNPLFFFDNDNDGLSSFLLLRRYIDRGKGVAIKSFPDLNVTYFRRVEELNPDYVFILDKPQVSKEFIKRVKQANIPIVWIDHHNVEVVKDFDIFYYNPVFENGSYEPVSYISYKITNKKEDYGLLLLGALVIVIYLIFTMNLKKNILNLQKKILQALFQFFILLK